MVIELADDGGLAVLRVSNTGEPLTASGVASLASMRASNKTAGGGAARPEAASSGAAGPEAASGGAAGPEAAPHESSRLHDVSPQEVRPQEIPPQAPHAAMTVGRFGVGFAAVRSVADDVVVASTSGSVAFSLDVAMSELRAAGIAEEQWRERGRWLPVLRLPVAVDDAPAEGATTTVTLRLRDAAAAAAVRDQLAAIDDTVLLGLPALRSITVITPEGTRVVADVDQRWLVLRRTGTLTDDDRSDDTVDDADPRWSVTVALPLPSHRGQVELPGVLLAPTPTVQPCTMPAVIIASFPLDPTRRHLRGGPRADAVVAAAAQVYADAAEQAVADGDDIAALLPSGRPADFVDLALREQAMAAISRAAVLHRLWDGMLVRPIDAVTLIDGDHAITAAMVPLAAALVAEPAHVAAVVGAQQRSVADVVEESVPSSPEQARRWYASLATVRSWGPAREGLARLRVPLADGRVVAGVRGTVMAPSSMTSLLTPFVPFGLRVVHPDAAHELLADLGATTGSPAQLLALPAVLEAITAAATGHDWRLPGREGELGAGGGGTWRGWSPDGDGRDAADERDDDERDDDERDDDDDVENDEDDDDDEHDADGPPAELTIADAVLGLVAACIKQGETVPAATVAATSQLMLRDVDGVPTSAEALVIPGSVAARILDDRVMAAVAPDLLQRWGQQVLVTVGVRDDLVVVVVPEVAPGDGDWGASLGSTEQTDALDGWQDYLAYLAVMLGRDAVLELVAIADLDAIVDWPAALAHIGGDPVLRAALVTTVRWRDRQAPSYTAWWLREVAEIGLDAPFALDSSLVGVLADAPAVARGLDRDVQRALGGCATLAELDTTDWELVLESWSAPDGAVAPGVAVAVWRALAAMPEGTTLEIATVPAVTGDGAARVVAADAAAVADSPMWWQRTDVAAMVPAAGRSASALADLLDLPLASELAAGRVDPATGESVDVPAGVRALLAGAPEQWCEHTELWVDGHAAEWWVDGDGPTAVVHAVTTAGLAKGLCQAAGRWQLRAVVELALGDPSRADELTIDAVADQPTAPPRD